MIDFACKKFDLNQVIKCSLGLTKSEFIVLQYFIRNSGYFKSDEVARETKFDLSSIQRAVKKLHEKGLITRSQENLKGGGYVFSYSFKGKKELIDNIMGTVNGWSNRVESELKRL
jgi:predicted transcriptional regulator